MEPIQGSLWRNKLCTHDLKSAQFPSVTESSIQISKTLPIVMESIAKMNFEKNKNKKSKLKIWSWEFGLKIEFRVENWNFLKVWKLWKKYEKMN